MSSPHNEARKAATEGSMLTVNSPDKATPQASQASAPYGVVRTEEPSQPANKPRAIPKLLEDAAIGNLKAIMSMKAEGQLGIYYPREVTASVPSLVVVNFDNIRDSAKRVLSFVLTEEVEKLKELDTATMQRQVQEISNYLANGICVMTYCKLYSLNYNFEIVSARYRIRPEVPDPFQIPAPYALAITQLGGIKISGMEQEYYFAPCAPANADTNFGCDPGFTWSPVVYSKYVVQAKRLGLQFSSVDLEVKMGSSWWLYRPEATAPQFTLQCPFPEENFTPNTAVLASLFCNNADGGFNNPIIDLQAIGDRTYCTFMRNPAPNISVHSYYAITEEKEIDFMY